MFTIPKVDFYITNVCNLSCRGCNRFNNMGLKGFQRWDAQSEQIEKWAQRVNFERITIIGGEPTLNVDLIKWCENLIRLWPNSKIMIQSNGTYIREEIKEFVSSNDIGFVVSLHDKSTVDKIKNDYGNNFNPYYIDAYVFHQNALIQQDDYWTVHNSNPDTSFAACGMRNDHTMFNGLLYKCPQVAILPEVYRQKDLRLSKRQLDIMLGYKPLTADFTDEEMMNFIGTADRYIPNCEFCPQDLVWRTAIGELMEGQDPPKFE